jgi:hypothetical protein
LPARGTIPAQDYSKHAHALTFRGLAALAAPSRWGSTSLRLGGNSSTAVTAVNHASFLFGTGDFTVEVWASSDDWTPATVNRFLVNVWRNDTANRSWAIDNNTDGTLRFLTSNNGTTTAVTLSFDASALVVGRFYHIAVTRRAGVFKMWVNGIEVVSATAAIDLLASNGTMNIGNNQNGAATWNTTNIWVGNVAGLRITKGAARTILLPTAQFPIG